MLWTHSLYPQRTMFSISNCFCCIILLSNILKFGLCLFCMVFYCLQSFWLPFFHICTFFKVFSHTIQSIKSPFLQGLLSHNPSFSYFSVDILHFWPIVSTLWGLGISVHWTGFHIFLFLNFIQFCLFYQSTISGNFARKTASLPHLFPITLGLFQIQNYFSSEW